MLPLACLVSAKESDWGPVTLVLLAGPLEVTSINGEEAVTLGAGGLKASFDLPQITEDKIGWMGFTYATQVRRGTALADFAVGEPRPLT